MTIERLATALADRYTLERELGQGGMATVYLAEDLKHQRKVAIKVLKPELAAVLGADRFVVEIKTTAALQHPHILPLFDSGSADGFLFYVMPFIQGETLRAKLDRETQFGIDEAVRIARDVADALDYAHRNGVVHRDIKPENILLHDGRPMVADFGIALALSAAAGGRMTETGMSLGTPHYMSPEQATADKEISGRSDIYSLGSVLYEMLTGNPPHTGSSAQQIIMKIIAEQPAAVTTYRKSVPPNVAAAVAKALEKLPADRFESAKAFADALADPRFTTVSTGSGNSPLTGSRRTVVWAGWGVAAAACAVAAWGWLRATPPPPVLRYTMSLPADQTLGINRGVRIALSPDGSRLVYVGVGPDGQQLMVRQRDQLTAIPMPGTPDAINPTFSPDGNRIALAAATGTGGIQVAGFSGAPPITIVEGTVGSDGLTWVSDGNIYYDGLTQGGTVGIMRVSAEGGPPVQVTTVDTAAGEIDHYWPQALPDARGVLFTILSRNTRDASHVAVLDLKSGETRVLFAGLTARYLASGHLIFVLANGSMVGVPFDLGRLAVTGAPFAISSDVATRAFGAVDVTVSENGTLIYTTGSQVDGDTELVRVGRDGTSEVVDSTLPPDMQTMALAPDGKRIALSVNSGTDVQVWVKELPRGPFTKVTFDGTISGRPAWSANGSDVGFTTDRAGRSEFWSVPADGSGPPRPLVSHPERPVHEGLWSRDGLWLINRMGDNSGVIQARRTSGDSTTQELTLSDAGVSAIALSPDGRWITYRSEESGRSEVYVRPFPAVTTGRWTVSIGGGWESTWRRDGRELFYISGDNRLMAVEIIPGPSFTMGQRTTLFDVSNFAAGIRSWDVAADGQHFHFFRLGGDERIKSELVVVEGFGRELVGKR
jgi:serine/threonine protein kinase/Tol biopolymer transport system component